MLCSCIASRDLSIPRDHITLLCCEGAASPSRNLPCSSCVLMRRSWKGCCACCPGSIWMLPLLMSCSMALNRRLTSAWLACSATASKPTGSACRSTTQVILTRVPSVTRRDFMADSLFQFCDSSVTVQNKASCCFLSDQLSRPAAIDDDYAVLPGCMTVYNKGVLFLLRMQNAACYRRRHKHMLTMISACNAYLRCLEVNCIIRICATQVC